MTSRCKLDENIISEILSYLPVKTLFKLRSVCKAFDKIISGDDGMHFLLAQSSHNSSSTSGFFLDDCSGRLLDLLLIDPNAGVRESSIDFLKAKTRFLGSAGGLVFFLLDSCRAFCVCNPARGTRCLLPRPPGQDACGHCRGSIAVSFVGDGVDYRLVYLTTTPEWTLFHWLRIYDSAAKQWTVFDKELDIGPRCLDFENPVVLSETVYWVSDCSPCFKVDPYIVALDLRRESTHLIALPGGIVVGGGHLGIAKWEESICLIYYCSVTSEFVLWVMNRKTEDGAPVDWVKFHEVSLASMGLRSGYTISFALVNNAKLLVFTIESSIYSYSMKDGEPEVLGSCEYWSPALISYCNTLRPCGEEEERSW